MKRKRHPREHMLSLCAGVRPDDGVDPRIFFDDRDDRREDDRTLARLCQQVARTLRLALDEAASDPVLASLEIVAVEPASGATRLIVHARDHATDPAGGEEILRHLDGALPRLRWEVARALSRRRAPELVFRLAGRGEGEP